MEESSNTEWLSSFLADSASIIKENPNRAKGILEDLAGQNHVKLIGSHEIFCRSEWKILGMDQIHETRGIAAASLQAWIEETYSESTARPWVEAITKAYGDCEGEIGGNEDANAWPGRPSAKLLLIALSSIILIAAMAHQIATKTQQKKDLNPRTAEKTSMRIRADQGAINGKKSDPSEGNISSTKVNDETEQKTAASLSHEQKQTWQYQQSEQRSRQVHYINKVASNSSNTKPRRNYFELEQGIEDGSLTLKDLTSEEALFITDHWIQSAKRAGLTLLLTLRTLNYVDESTCSKLREAYQNLYSKYGLKKVKVNIQSTRPEKTRTAAGFLTVCIK